MTTLNICLRLHKKDAESGMSWVSFEQGEGKFFTSVKCGVKDWDNSKCKVKKAMRILKIKILSSKTLQPELIMFP